MTKATIVFLSAIVVFAAACSGSTDTSDTNPVPIPSTTTSVATVAVPDSEATTTTSIVGSTVEPSLVPVTVVRDEPYRLSGDEAGVVSVVDIYSPDDAGPHQGVVLLHGFSGGGSYPSPDTDLAPMAEAIAGMGAVVFNFYWHTRDGFDADSAGDLSCIGAFMSARAAEFGVDPKELVVVGHSMGGATGTMLAMRSFALHPSDTCTETGNSAHAVAVLGIGGTYGLTARPLDEEHSRFRTHLRLAYPPVEADADEEVAPGMTALDAYELDPYSAIPPSGGLRIVLLVGEIDYYPITGPKVTAAFSEALEANGVQHELVQMDGAGHEDIVDPNTESGQTTLQLIDELINPTP